MQTAFDLPGRCGELVSADATYLVAAVSPSQWENRLIDVKTIIFNLEREYRDCRRDKIGITRHIIMHQVLYNVHVTLFIW